MEEDGSHSCWGVEASARSVWATAGIVAECWAPVPAVVPLLLRLLLPWWRCKRRARRVEDLEELLLLEEDNESLLGVMGEAEAEAEEEAAAAATAEWGV